MPPDDPPYAALQGAPKPSPDRAATAAPRDPAIGAGSASAPPPAFRTAKLYASDGVGYVTKVELPPDAPLDLVVHEGRTYRRRDGFRDLYDLDPSEPAVATSRDPGNPAQHDPIRPAP